VKLLTVAPFRVWPPTSGAPLLVDGASRALAAAGCPVRVFSTGVRRGSLAADLRPQEHEVVPGYRVYNYATPLSVLLNLRSRQSSGRPPLGTDRALRFQLPARLGRWLDFADVVQVEGPYGFRSVRERLVGPRTGTPMVLVCHNVEGRLTRISHPVDRRLIRRVTAVEGEAARAAEGIIALTSADREALVADYGVDPAKVRIIPCGVDLNYFRPVPDADREAAKAKLGLSGRTVAVFTGARYRPNVEALRHLERMAQNHGAPDGLPDGLTFLVVGRVGEEHERADDRNGRLLATGFVPEMGPYLRAADLAVVPMQSGGGMHLKVLEFLAMGIPVVATRLAARGLDGPLPEGVTVCPTHEMPKALAEWSADAARRAEAGAVNRAWVADRYGWERIAERRMALYEGLL
jgi:glycosyltransferase involved in cell wall biosynthesis